MDEGKGELTQLTIASHMGEAQPRVGLARATPKKLSRTSVSDDSVLKKVCQSLEAAGLSVVVVVALDANPALAATGRTVRRVRRSLETTGMAVVADLASGVGTPAKRLSGKANLALVRDETNDDGVGGGRPAHGEEPGRPVIVLTTAADEAAARTAFVSGGLGFIVKVSATAPANASSTFVARGGERRQAAAPAVSGGAAVLDDGGGGIRIEIYGAGGAVVRREHFTGRPAAKLRVQGGP